MNTLWTVCEYWANEVCNALFLDLNVDMFAAYMHLFLDLNVDMFSAYMHLKCCSQWHLFFKFTVVMLNNLSKHNVTLLQKCLLLQ